jgi:hypothetical protein
MRGEKFEGAVCKKCGSVIRYVKDKKCVACIKNKHLNWSKTERGQEYLKISSRKKSDLKLYGVCADAEKTKRRREAEERLLNKKLGIEL